MGHDLSLPGRVRDIGGKHRDVRVVRLDDRAADRLRVIRRQYDRCNLLRDEVLDLTLLFGIVAARVDDRYAVAVLRRLRLHSRFHLFVELRFAILNGDADRFGALRRRGAGRRIARRRRTRRIATCKQSHEQDAGWSGQAKRHPEASSLKPRAVMRYARHRALRAHRRDRAGCLPDPRSRPKCVRSRRSRRVTDVAPAAASDANPRLDTRSSSRLRPGCVRSRFFQAHVGKDRQRAHR